MLLQLMMVVDTLLVPSAASTTGLDLAPPDRVIQGRTGAVDLWVRRIGAEVVLAVRVPDRTPSWRDAVILCLDTEGDRAPAPQHDDFQWEFHRTLDSSVVFRGGGGAWRAPRDDPDWRLGALREMAGWTVRGASEPSGWTVEIHLVLEYFRSGPGMPGIALQVYDDELRSWSGWPVVSGWVQPQAIQRRPDRWAVVRLLTP